MMRLPLCLAGLLVVLPCFPLTAADGPSLHGMAIDTWPREAANCVIALEFVGLGPDRKDGPIPIQLHRLDGAWAGMRMDTGRYNRAANAFDGSGLTWSGTAVGGSLQATFNSDGWVPKDKLAHILDVTVAVDLAAALAGDGETVVEGTWQGTDTAGGKPPVAVSGIVRARVNPILPPGHWSSGSRVDGGIAFAFDLGAERVNWNRFRAAVQELPAVTDLSAHAGIEITVATEAPRGDAEVAVWLREEDGSWYYLRSACALVDGENRARIPFTAFAEAEWIAPSPGTHQDEDYTLDLARISHVAVGVCNPFGVGEVRFTLQALDAYGTAPVFAEPAAVLVTGKTLAVNGHSLIAAGVFGGYAQDLPQEYRPGCQRGLYPSTMPRDPRFKYYRVEGHELVDWQALLASFKAEAPAPAYAHLLQVAGQKIAQGVTRFNLEKHQKKSGDAVPGALPNVLNQAMAAEGFFEASVWPGPLGADLAAEVARFDELNPVERLIVNRKLLDRLLGPEVLRPVGPGPSEMFIIDCLGERKQQAWFMANDHWQKAFEDWGRKYAENAAALGYDDAVFEMWNEPYLHWDKDRINLKNAFFREDLAQEGGPVMMKRQGGKVEGEIVPHLEWQKDDRGKWKVVDPTSFTYWSGKANGWIYDQQMAAIGPAIKAANPKVRVLAGWGFRWHEDHWAAWDVLYKNTIDRNIDWIDGVHEHHYQGDVVAMAASYEVLTTYSQTAHDKWLYGCNTETEDLLDAPARGAVTSSNKYAVSQYRRMSYNLRDCLAMLALVPDKVLGRTVIHPNKNPQAIEVAYGLMRDLRGRLVEVDVGDPLVYAVASIDGTDPKAIDPAYDGQRMVLCVFNDHRVERDITVTLAPPTGTNFADGFVERVTVETGTFRIDRLREDLAAAGKQEVSVTVTVPARLAFRVVLPLVVGIEAEAEAEVVVDQAFAPDIIRFATRDEPLATTIAVSPEQRAGIKRAWLRVVLESVADGEAVCMINGSEIPLPAAYTADNVMRIRDVPIDLGLVKDENQLVFEVRGNNAGYRVCAASLRFER